MSKTASKRKTWAAVILTALALSGCRASQVQPRAEAHAAVTLSHQTGAAAGHAALASLPGTIPAQADGYRKTGCMDFGWNPSGSSTAAFIALGIVLSPLLIVVGALYLLAP